MNLPLTRRAALAAAAASALASAVDCCSAEGGHNHEEPAAAVASTPLSATGGPHMIMIVRHGEKPADGGDVKGVTADGQHDKESLTVRGWTRAGALVGLFDPRAADGGALPPRPGLARPACLFASDPGGHGSKRPLQTITPLADALGITPDTRFDKGQEEQLVAALANAPDPVLISWQHESIGAIVAGLGPVHPQPPASWPGARFDMVYVFTRADTGWTFAQIPQMLLAGDSPTPFQLGSGQ